MVMPLPTSGRSTCTFPSFAAAERERSALPLAREGKREWSCLSLHLSDDATLEYREQNHSMGTGERCTRSGGERTERARAPHKVPSRYPAYVAPLPIERGLSVPQSSRSATSLTRALSPHRKNSYPVCCCGTKPHSPPHAARRESGHASPYISQVRPASSAATLQVETRAHISPGVVIAAATRVRDSRAAPRPTRVAPKALQGKRPRDRDPQIGIPRQPCAYTTLRPGTGVRARPSPLSRKPSTVVSPYSESSPILLSGCPQRRPTARIPTADHLMPVT